MTVAVTAGGCRAGKCSAKAATTGSVFAAIAVESRREERFRFNRDERYKNLQA